MTNQGRVVVTAAFMTVCRNLPIPFGRPNGRPRPLIMRVSLRCPGWSHPAGETEPGKPRVRFYAGEFSLRPRSK